MRHFIDIVQQAMSDRPLLCEGDVTDFEEFRKKRAQGDGQSPNTAIPGSLRYAAALDQQQDQPPANLSDHLRTLVLRNLDAAFGNGEWQPDDLHTIRVFVKHWNSEDRRKVQPLVNKALSLADKRDGVCYFIGSPSRRSAYLKDNEMLAHWRLETETKSQTFETEEDLFYHILKHMVVADDGQWSEDELTHMTEYLVKVEDRRTRNPGKDDWNPAADDDEGPFDPDAVPTYADRPDSYTLIPSVEKFLSKFSYDRNGDDLATFCFIGVSHGFSGDAIGLSFHSPHEPTRKITFPDLRALERWVNTHREGIERWARAQESNGDALQQRTVNKVVRSILALYRLVIAANASGTALDEAKIKEWCGRLQEPIWSITETKLQEFLSSSLWNVERPGLREFITDYHLTWLPEQVQKLQSKD